MNFLTKHYSEGLWCKTDIPIDENPKVSEKLNLDYFVLSLFLTTDWYNFLLKEEHNQVHLLLFQQVVWNKISFSQVEQSQSLEKEENQKQSNYNEELFV